MPAPRVIIFGYGALALAALETCVDLGISPLAVVVPGNRQGHDVEMVVARAGQDGWPIMVQPVRSQSPPFIAAVRAIDPDVMVVWSYPMLLPPELISLAGKGAFNLHSGLLPEYRGGHVVNWALINGERESGVTLHHLDAGIDTGPVVGDERFAIDWRDDVATVHLKLKTAGQSLLRRWWPAIERGDVPSYPQDESRARYYRMRTAADGRIDWSASNVAIYNLVRALVAPWPGAFTTVGEVKLVIRRVEPVESAGDTTPGAVARADDSGVWVSAGSGTVQLLEVEIDHRRASPADLRMNGVVSGVHLV